MLILSFLINITNLLLLTLDKCIKLTKTKKISEDKYYLDIIKNSKFPQHKGKYSFEIADNVIKSLRHFLFKNNKKCFI